MRQELLDPLKDFPLYLVARELVLRIYMCLQGGADCSEQLAELNALCKTRLTAWDIEAAAELIEPDEYAFALLADQVPTPTDLTYAEMLELVEKLKANAAENGIQAGYWERCLTINTGDSRFSSLLQGGAETYFRDGVSRWLTAKEILDTALAAGVKANPESGASPNGGQDGRPTAAHRWSAESTNDPDCQMGDDLPF